MTASLPAAELRASGVAVTLLVHEHKRLGRGIELAALAEQLRAAGIGLEFLTGELQGSHDPSGVVLTVLAALSGMEREYVRDRTLEGHESARTRGKAIGGAAVTDDAMLAVALHLRGQELSLRDIAARLVIATGKKKGQHPSPATVLRMPAAENPTTPTRGAPSPRLAAISARTASRGPGCRVFSGYRNGPRIARHGKPAHRPSSSRAASSPRIIPRPSTAASVTRIHLPSGMSTVCVMGILGLNTSAREPSADPGPCSRDRRSCTDGWQNSRTPAAFPAAGRARRARG